MGPIQTPERDTDLERENQHLGKGSPHTAKCPEAELVLYFLLHQTHPESSFLHIVSRRGRIPSKAHLSLPGKKKVQNKEAETVE